MSAKAGYKTAKLNLRFMRQKYHEKVNMTKDAHIEPCSYTKATRWYMVSVLAIILALLVGGLGFIRAETSAIQADQKHDSQLLRTIEIKQEVLDKEVKIRLDNIESIVREIRTELKRETK